MEEESLSNCDGLSLNRRRFIGVWSGVGAVLLAGCVGDDELPNGDSRGGDDEANGDDTSDGNDDDADGNEETGTFRLLISDQPVAIDEFDSLEVTLDEARIFGGPDEAGGEDEETTVPNGDDNGGEDESGENGGDDENGDNDPDDEDNGNDDNDDEEDEADDADDDGDDAPGQRGFFFIDLDGATVDLTEVVGEKAMDVFDGELPAGRYTKIELYPENVEGIVDSEEVTVHVPSDKLQITKPFEVEAGETLSFVFDINVVRRGQTGEYNLTPVIAESGVAGEDVEVEEVENETDGGNGDETGPPDDAGPDDDTGN